MSRIICASSLVAPATATAASCQRFCRSSWGQGEEPPDHTWKPRLWRRGTSRGGSLVNRTSGSHLEPVEAHGRGPARQLSMPERKREVRTGLLMRLYLPTSPSKRRVGMFALLSRGGALVSPHVKGQAWGMRVSTSAWLLTSPANCRHDDFSNLCFQPQRSSSSVFSRIPRKQKCDTN